jgi:uncharacterized protein (TIGR02391 family)
MTIRKLDPILLKKLSQKTGKEEKYLREQICKKASQLGIYSEAYLILWAKKLKIGTLRVERKISKNFPQILDQIRESMPYFLEAPRAFKRKRERISQTISYPSLRLAIENLIDDEDLKSRCKDLLRTKKYFDRVFREATTILEDRIRNISEIDARGVDLVAKALNPDPNKAVIKVSNDPSEQEGVFNLCKGIILVFRNPTHHKLTDQFNEKDALRFISTVDLLLAIIKGASK